MIKKLMTACVAATLLLCTIFSGTANAAPSREEERQRCHSIPTDTNSLPDWPTGPTVYAESAIVMDIDTGAILFGKQVDQKHFPASITKLLTVLVALENSKPEDEVLFTQDSISFLEYGDAHIGMRPDEIISMEDALYAVLYASANEVSYAVAESTGKLMGGGYDTFIQEMNDRSAELGCAGSHWTNANGLHNEEHYTTARDMALIASAVYKRPEFQEIMSGLSHTIPETNLVKETRTFQQRHEMLWPRSDNYYEYCKGGKTGYTDQARTTLVSMADNGSSRLAAVVLYDFGKDAYKDTRAMFDYVFGNFSPVSLSESAFPEGVEAFVQEDASLLLPSGVGLEKLEAKVTLTDLAGKAGVVKYTYHGQDLGSVEVKLTEEYVEKIVGKSVKDDKEEKPQPVKKEKTGLSFRAKAIIGVLIFIAVMFVLYYIYVRYRRLRRRRQRELQRRRRQQQRHR